MDTAPARTRLLTGEELLAMGDIGPCELIDGEIVPMSPTGGLHGWIESTLDRTLGVMVDERDLGWVMVGEVGIYTRRNPDRVRGADVAFWSHERLPDGPPPGFLDVAPNLVVEIISPNDRWQDIREKIEEYFAIGVDRVWVVVPRTRSVLVYESPTTLRQLKEGDILEGEGVLEGFTLPVVRLFASRRDEE